MESQGLEAPAQNAALWEDFVDIFLSPREVFERRRTGTFIAALIILTILLAILAVPMQMGMAGAVEASLREGLQNPGMSEMSEAQLQQIRRFSMVGAVVGTLFATPVGIVLTGLVLWVAARFLEVMIPLASAMMIATYAAFPKILASLATMLQALLLEPTRVTQFSIGPARVLGEGSDPIVSSLLLRLDLFVIWGVILLAIGASTVGRTTSARGWAVALITWIVGVVPTIALGALAGRAG